MAIGRVNTGGGGSGGTLTVTGIAGHTVTATKDGKTYTRTFNSNGVAVFKGLSTGTWTLTMTGDGQTATRTVTVNADYAVIITYFSATISVTYPAGSNCTCTDGTTTMTAPDTSGSHTFVVPNAGTWTVSCTDGTDTASKDVAITTDGQSESVTLEYIPEGALYYYGDERTDTTGGWKKTNPYSQYSTGTLTKYDDYIKLSATGVDTVVRASTQKTISLSGYDTLILNVTKYSSAGGEHVLGICESSDLENIIATAGITAAGAVALDVSGYTGKYVVVVEIWNGPNASGTTTIQFNEVIRE